MSEGPLAGQTILVTRAKEQAQSLSTLIRKYGGTPLEVPLIAFKRPSNQEHIEQVKLALWRYQWLIFTSANGVRFFFENNQPFNKRSRSEVKIAVVGKKTEQMLQQFEITADLVPADYVAEGLVAALSGKVKKGDHIVVARGNLGRPLIIDELRQLGTYVEDLTVYETYWPKINSTFSDIIRQRPSYITFTSSSTIKHFVKALEQVNLDIATIESKIVCIGPVARKTAIQAGLKVEIMPSTYTIEAMIHAMIAHSKEDIF